MVRCIKFWGFVQYESLKFSYSMFQWVTKETIGSFSSDYIGYHTVKKSTKTYIFTARCEHLTTGREIDKEDFNSLFHAKEVGNKHFEAFLLETLVEDKKPYSEPFFKAILNWKREEKKFLKPLSVVKEVCQNFGLLIYKVVKSKCIWCIQICNYISTSTCANLNPTLYQPDKAGLKNCIINLPRSSSHEHPRYVKWVVDGLAEIRSVPPIATNEE